MRTNGTVGLVVLLGMLGCSAPRPDGKQVFWETGCARCHEANGSGGAMGPPLANLARHWTPEVLEQFLENPSAYLASDPRLQKIRAKYFTPMPRLMIPPDRRKILVDFLLKEMK